MEKEKEESKMAPSRNTVNITGPVLILMIGPGVFRSIGRTLFKIFRNKR